MIIDAHVHIGPESGQPATVPEYRRNLQKLQHEMRSAGVAHSLLMPYFTNKDRQGPSLAQGLAVAGGVSNVSIIGTLDMTKPRAELKRIEGLARSRRIVGLKLYTGYQAVMPNDKRLVPVYRLCQSIKLPVIYHSGDTWTGVPNSHVRFAHPLVIDDVATDYPDLTIVIAHLGNPWLIDTAELLYRHTNVFADLSGLFIEKIDPAYARMMRQRIYELTIYSSARKLLFGTDWPLIPVQAHLRFVKSLQIPKADMPFVLYKNAQRIFRIQT